MKVEITNKEAKVLARTKCYAFGYCEIQELLKYEDPIYYTRGVYGRKADFYIIEHPETMDRIRISTGYAPEGERVNYEKTRQLEQQARKMSYNSSISRKHRNRIALYRLCRGYN